MIIFRSDTHEAGVRGWSALLADPDWRVRLAHYAAVIGAVGFFACWAIGWEGQAHILGNPEFMRATAEHPIAVAMKGKTYFAEPVRGALYNLSQALIIPCVALAVLGAAYMQRRIAARRRQFLERLSAPEGA